MGPVLPLSSLIALRVSGELRNTAGSGRGPGVIRRDVCSAELPRSWHDRIAAVCSDLSFGANYLRDGANCLGLLKSMRFPHCYLAK
jgi:hypothetical protein